MFIQKDQKSNIDPSNVLKDKIFEWEFKQKGKVSRLWWSGYNVRITSQNNEPLIYYIQEKETLHCTQELPA